MESTINRKEKLINITVQEKLKQDLVRDGLISEEKLKEAEANAREGNETLSNALISLGFLTEEKLVSFVGEKMHIPYVNIKDYSIDDKVLELIPEKIILEKKILPLFKIEDTLTIAMSDPLDIISLDTIARFAGCMVEAVIASEESIVFAIKKCFEEKDESRGLVVKLSEEFEEKEKKEQHQTALTAKSQIEEKGEEQPIVKLVNKLFMEAIKEGASDIHLEPKKESMQVRFRIDGFLYNRHNLSANLAAPVTSRIKVMAGLDISKKRIPQDGRFGFAIKDKSIDFRASTLPAMYGENVVLRILDKTSGRLTIPDLGFSKKDIEIFKRLIYSTKGIILATGPTGSGKTTTVYSAINTLNTGDTNIMTIEDPIEYEIESIVQSQVNPKAGVTFANSLSSILRQDPDIIYVGEIRDVETANIAMRAALTGHLVLSTLHTNNAVGAITRLTDIGVAPSLIESVLICSFSQRLVRKICTRCSKPYKPDKNLLQRMKLSPDTRFYRGEGCESCNHIGYRGRVGIFEILAVDREVRRLIIQKASESEIIKAARTHGMKSIFIDGMLKVIKGITTIEEVKRATK